MPKYVYSARDKDSKLLHGIVEQVDEEEAITTLHMRGLVIVSIKPEKKRVQKETGKARRLKRKLKLDDLILFSRQMATLLNAGVTLLRGLSIISRQINSKPLHDAVDKVHIDVEEGHSLHEALSRHPRIFTPLWINLVQTGEASGQLAPAFEQLSAYMETTAGILRKVKSAMVYPAILLVVCIAAILVFSLKVIPMFGEIYKGFNIQLPGLTVAVLNFSDLIRRYIIFIIGGWIALFFVLKRLVNTSPGRIIFDDIKLKVPIFGPLVKGVVIERFAHGLSTLIRSGIPILYALEIVGKVVGNKTVENAINSVKEEVRTGKPMAAPLEATGLFPVMVSQMINVGEETGKLSEMLDRVTVYYQETVNTAVDRMTAAFEPLLLVFMGATVGTLVVAMYLPIFKIATGMGGH